MTDEPYLSKLINIKNVFRCICEALKLFRKYRCHPEYFLLNCLGGSSVCFGSIETLCFGVEAKQPKQTASKQTEKNEKKRKNPKFSVKK